MSSVIVLDSSDDDERQLKRAKVIQTNVKITKNVNSSILDGSVRTISNHLKSGLPHTNATTTCHYGSIFTTISESHRSNIELETSNIFQKTPLDQSSIFQNSVKKLSTIIETKCEKSKLSKLHNRSQLRIQKAPTLSPTRGAMLTSPKSTPYFASPSGLEQFGYSTCNDKANVEECTPELNDVSSIHPTVQAERQPPLKLMATPPHNVMVNISNGDDGRSENYYSANQIVLSFENDNQYNNSNSAANFCKQQFIINKDIDLKTDAPQTSNVLQNMSVSTTTTAVNVNTTFFTNASISKPIRRVKPISIEKHNIDVENDKFNIGSKFLSTFPSTISSRILNSNQSHVISDRLKFQNIILTKNYLNKTVSDIRNNQIMPEYNREFESSRTNNLFKRELLNDPVVNSQQKKQNCSKCISSFSKKPNHTEALKFSKFKAGSDVEYRMEDNYRELIQLCRQTDSSADMEKLIRRKLIKYYFEVHPDFTKSKSFHKNIRRVIESIRSEPDLIYYNLRTIVEELKIRRNTQTTIASDIQSNIQSSIGQTENEVVPIHYEANSQTNWKTDGRIRKLNKALYILTKRIDILERAEVDLDNEDSTYLQVERFKKRACQIYEKICDLTGESKNARRLVKKPIKFNDTAIPQFNKTLQTFINRTREFPDYFDVLRMLEHCNRSYNLGLLNNQIKNIAEEAFIKVGKLLQSRRRTELYETLNYFAGNYTDPAISDPLLAAKLNENQQKQKKISDIIEKFVLKQEMPKNDNFCNTTKNMETANNIAPRGCYQLSIPTEVINEANTNKPSSSALETSLPLCEIPFKTTDTINTLPRNTSNCNKQLKEAIYKINIKTSDTIQFIDESDTITNDQETLESKKIIIKSNIKITKKQNDVDSNHLLIQNEEYDEILNKQYNILPNETDCCHVDNIENDTSDLRNMKVMALATLSTKRKGNCSLHVQQQQKQQLFPTPNINLAHNSSHSQAYSSNAFVHPKQLIILNDNTIKTYIQQQHCIRSDNINKSNRTHINSSSIKLHQENYQANKFNINDEVKTVKLRATHSPEISQISDMATSTSVTFRKYNEVYSQCHSKLSQAELKVTAASAVTPKSITINNRATDKKIVTVTSLSSKLRSETVNINLPAILKNTVNIIDNNNYKNGIFEGIIISDDES